MSRKKFIFSQLPFNTSKFDVWLFVVVIILVLFGLMMVYNASIVVAERDFADKYRFIADQAKFAVVGIISMIIVSFVHYHFWRKLALPLLLGMLIFLVLVFIPGLGIKALGASRWLDFHLFVVQPAEIAKLTLTIYLASWLTNKERGRFFAFVLLVGLVIGLVILEPDMGTSVVLGALAIMLYFLSGAPIYQFLLLIPASLISLFVLIKLAPYRLERVFALFNPERDPLGTSYHIRQILLALGSGGISGLGFGKSLQKYAYLPESTTDSIFAIIAEELGFIGASITVLAFLFLVWRGFMIAARAPDLFGKLLAAGITSFLAIQIIINLSAQVALLPFTGIPLPFISYGGSSLVISLISIGILLNISRKPI